MIWKSCASWLPIWRSARDVMLVVFEKMYIVELASYCGVISSFVPPKNSTAPMMSAKITYKIL